jgi:hypothetical protein
MRPWPAMRSQPTCLAWKGGMSSPGSRLESATGRHWPFDSHAHPGLVSTRVAVVLERRSRRFYQCARTRNIDPPCSKERITLLVLQYPGSWRAALGGFPDHPRYPVHWNPASNGFHALSAQPLSHTPSIAKPFVLSDLVLAAATAGCRLGSDEGGGRDVMLPSLGEEKGLASSADAPLRSPASP